MTEATALREVSVKAVWHSLRQTVHPPAARLVVRGAQTDKRLKVGWDRRSRPTLS